MSAECDDRRPVESSDDGSLVNRSAVTAQVRALDAVREVGVLSTAEHLKLTTGTVAELNAAKLRGALDGARRQLIARKGAGVVFEAETVIRLQMPASGMGSA